MKSEPITRPAALEPAPQHSRRTASRAWQRFRRHRGAMVGSIVLGVLILSAALAPWIAPFGMSAQNLENMLGPPTLLNPLGTDELGRDMLTRLLWGGRVSLAIGFLVTLVAITLGVVVGGLAGTVGGWLDAALMRFVDLMLVFPDLMLLILFAALFGTNFISIVLVLGALSWMNTARLVRASFIALREREFVDASRALGARRLEIAWRHLLPNALGPLTVAATLNTASAILAESTLSYLGLGVQPPTPSWGNMLQTAQSQIAQAPWTAIYPGIMIFVTVLAINFVGDGLRDALDPRHAEG